MDLNALAIDQPALESLLVRLYHAGGSSALDQWLNPDPGDELLVVTRVDAAPARWPRRAVRMVIGLDARD